MGISLSEIGAEWLSWGISAGILALFILLALASKLILTWIVQTLAHRTKTTLDDLIVHSLTRPVFVALIVVGLWIALARLPELAPYINIIHKVFIIIYIGIAAVAVVRVVHAFLTWYGTEVATRTKTNIDNRLVPILKRVVDIAIYAIALMIILDRLNVNISPILAGLGIGGLAVALALQSTLSNFLAGTYVITDAVIQKGHYVMLDSGQEGTIEDIGWRTTKIRHWQGNLIVLPNSKLAEAIVTDFEMPDTSMVFTIDCGVSYDSDLVKVERITLEVASELLKKHPAGAKDFEPAVRFKQFGDSNINFAVIMKGIDRLSQFILKHEFVKALHQRFQEEGIEIQYPARKLYLADRSSELFRDVIQGQIGRNDKPI
jgi:small-conductance mechanosensitive channel